MALGVGEVSTATMLSCMLCVQPLVAVLEISGFLLLPGAAVAGTVPGMVQRIWLVR